MTYFYETGGRVASGEGFSLYKLPVAVFVGLAFAVSATPVMVAAEPLRGELILLLACTDCFNNCPSICLDVFQANDESR